MTADKLQLATEANFLEAYARTRRGDAYDRQLLSFAVGAEVYAMDLALMREIVKPRPVTEVPRVPPFVLGVVSVRGDIVPVLDLRARLGFEPAQTTRATRLLICEVEGEAYALRVDAVRGVVRLREADVELAMAATDSPFLEAIARHDDELIILLDIPTVVRFDVAGAGGRR